MRYLILKNSSYNMGADEAVEDLKNQVNTYLDEGWSLVGGLAVEGTIDGQFLYQALTIEDAE